MERPSDGYLTGFAPAPSPDPVLSVLGWILLLAAVAAVAVAAVRRRDPRELPPRSPMGENVDMASLGLSSVRPAQAAPGEDVPMVRPAAAGDVSRPVAASRPSGAAVQSGGPWEGLAVPLLLRSLSALTGGPVAVVARDGEAYRVEARTDGGSMAPVVAPDLGLDGPAELGFGQLGPLAELVGGSARAVPMGPHLVLLGGRDRDRQREVVEQFLDLLVTLTPDARPPEPPRRAVRVDVPPPAVLPAAVLPAAEPDEAPVPRAVIIAEEQAAALDDGRPLAFALVTLADAEDQLTKGTPESVAQASASLRDRLETADDVRRVEPFGDLLFGVFVDRDREGAAAWCNTLASADPPLFIGAVAPADGDPADVRAAATSALRDAYDQQRTRVVGV